MAQYGTIMKLIHVFWLLYFDTIIVLLYYQSKPTESCNLRATEFLWSCNMLADLLTRLYLCHVATAWQEKAAEPSQLTQARFSTCCRLNLGTLRVEVLAAVTLCRFKVSQTCKVQNSFQASPPASPEAPALGSHPHGSSGGLRC